MIGFLQQVDLYFNGLLALEELDYEALEIVLQTCKEHVFDKCSATVLSATNQYLVWH